MNEIKNDVKRCLNGHRLYFEETHCDRCSTDEERKERINLMRKDWEMREAANARNTENDRVWREDVLRLQEHRKKLEEYNTEVIENYKSLVRSNDRLAAAVESLAEVLKSKS